MPTPVYKLCGELRAKLSELEHELASLEERMAANPASAPIYVRNQLARLSERQTTLRPKLAAAISEIMAWAQREMCAATKAGDGHDLYRLRRRRLASQRYANAFSDLAAQAVDDAAHAALNAWLVQYVALVSTNRADLHK